MRGVVWLTDSFLGKAEPPSGGGAVNGYEWAVQHVPQTTMSYCGELNSDPAYTADVPLQFPLVFQSRTFTNYLEFIDALGGSTSGKVMAAGNAVPDIYIGIPLMGLSLGFRVIGKNQNVLQEFDMVIFAKFDG